VNIIIAFTNITVTDIIVYILYDTDFSVNPLQLSGGENALDNADFTMEFKKLGLKVAYYRKLKGYTQEELSELMGVATSYIGAIEAPNMDKPISLTTLFKIAGLLNTPAWKFLDFD
jgi:DNA-binding XRE family transcriptional regulator